MAEIVLGIGTSHTPLFTLDSSDWRHRAQADFNNPALNLSDGRRMNYAQLLAEVGPRYAEAAQPEELQRKARRCEAALDHLGDILEIAAPDIALIVGDDQGELFGTDNQPAFAVYYADNLVTSDAYGHEDSPDWVRTMGRGYMMDDNHAIPGDAEFGLKVVHGLIDREVDVAAVARIGERDRCGLGHAFGFVVKRLFRNRPIPVVPILLNTYFQPNVASASRCYDIGVKLREVIAAIDGNTRVAIIASGGLSHFVVDETLDLGVLEALQSNDARALRALPRGALNSGSSEILNWVLAAGALQSLPVAWKEYIPIYRTPAGTGVGAAFVVWKPA
ncbi:DODA-type extradiol aromatic ring-opening family dioxygenase [Paraburkholderia dipogonis]|jgi:hypothetical protein|uniref:DODA-type extradiol aromatic ring-opening family dioxygenase n=1 Tax=Paraburkholderia dipogonis TaxID=1211383 RepID=UPI0038BC4039